MRERNQTLPLSGPNSDPVRYGVASALSDLFPVVEGTAPEGASEDASADTSSALSDETDGEATIA